MTVSGSFIQNLTPKQRVSVANHTLQVNIGLKCNLACSHCHLESGPHRKEMMSPNTMEQVLNLYKAGDFKLLDITGGEPAMHPHIEWFLKEAQARQIPIMLRTNLTLLTDPAYSHLLNLFVETGVYLVASLPCYLQENVDAIRGAGVFEKSITSLKALNKLGYGRDESLVLDLVYSPAKPVLPGSQAELQAAYSKRLKQDHGIVFNNLFVITNMDLGRFAKSLKSLAQAKDEYKQLLKDNFNPATLENMMCRHQISVGYDGSLYDCDFNLALGQKATPAHISKTSGRDLLGRIIHFAEHCYGCTAGAGSS